jgi:hypothetical protein
MLDPKGMIINIDEINLPIAAISDSEDESDDLRSIEELLEEEIALADEWVE